MKLGCKKLLRGCFGVRVVSRRGRGVKGVTCSACSMCSMQPRSPPSTAKCVTVMFPAQNGSVAGTPASSAARSTAAQLPGKGVEAAPPPH